MKHREWKLDRFPEMEASYDQIYERTSKQRRPEAWNPHLKLPPAPATATTPAPAPPSRTS